MGQYTYIGEPDLVVPNTLDGPRVISTGDVVSLPDDESLDGRPDFEPVAAEPPAGAPVAPSRAKKDTGSPAPAPDPVTAPDGPTDDTSTDHEGPQEPTA